jgi:hypothetical protein
MQAYVITIWTIVHKLSADLFVRSILGSVNFLGVLGESPIFRYNNIITIIILYIV